MKKSLFAVALVGLLSAPALVGAQTAVGASLSYHNDFDLGVGAYVAVPITGLHENLAFSGNFGYYFPGDGGVAGTSLDYWEINGDLLYRFPTPTSIQPFLLGGINIARIAVGVDIGGLGTVSGSSTEIGLNLGGGIAFSTQAVTPQVGAKFQIDGGDGFVVFGGVGIPLG